MKADKYKFVKDFRELKSRILEVLIEGESSHVIVAVFMDLIYQVCLQEDDPKIALEEMERAFKTLREEL